MSSGTAVFLKFDALYSLEYYIKSVYYNTYSLTLYFQVQFINAHSSPSEKNAIKYALKKERFLTRRERVLDAEKGKYHEYPK